MRASWFFTILVACAEPPPVATGEISTWVVANALPTPRANHCSAVIDDWVVVIGGNYAVAGGFEKTSEIHVAQIDAGVLGAWQLAGHTPSPVTECAATSDGRRLVVVDGIYDDEQDEGQVWFADLDADGRFTEMTAMGTLPEGTRALSTEAAVRDGQLLVMDTLLPDEGDTTVMWQTPVARMTWSQYDWNIGFRAQSQYAFGERFVYTIGGYEDAAAGAVTDVFVAPIEGGAPRATTPLPVPVGFGEAVVADDWLFVIGGRAQVFGAPGTADVYAAPIAADGSLGAWQLSTALPMARTNHELVLVGDHLVVTGGAAMGPGDATVLTSQVRWSQSQ